MIFHNLYDVTTSQAMLRHLGRKYSVVRMGNLIAFSEYPE
jgi:hypothetical protein